MCMNQRGKKKGIPGEHNLLNSAGIGKAFNDESYISWGKLIALKKHCTCVMEQIQKIFYFNNGTK